MMEEFFREGTIPIHDLIPAVRKAIVAEKIFPVLMVSSLHNIGTASLLTFLTDAFPHPMSMAGRIQGSGWQRRPC